MRIVLEATGMTEVTKRVVKGAVRMKLRRQEHSYGLGKRPMKEREE